MKTYGKFALPVLLTAAALTLGACGGPESGAGGQGQGGDGMQGMDHGNNNANNNGVDVGAAMGEDRGVVARPPSRHPGGPSG